MPNKRLETSLYGPVKHYLEMLGFTVKGEVCGCDLVALRGDEPPMVVIGETTVTARSLFEPLPHGMAKAFGPSKMTHLRFQSRLHP